MNPELIEDTKRLLDEGSELMKRMDRSHALNRLVIEHGFCLNGHERAAIDAILKQAQERFDTLAE